jgi:Xaa-Pro aminopeptidase
MRYTPKSELDARTRKFQTSLATEDLDGALIAQNADLFYFAGTIQQSQLYIPRQGLPILMTRRSFARARQESSLERIVPLESLRDLSAILQEYGYPQPKRLGLELDVLPTNSYFAVQEIFPQATFFDVSPAIRNVRAVKSIYELSAMQRSAKMAEQTMCAMRHLLVEGIREIELAGKLEALARGLGHQGLARFRLWNNEMFYGHLIAGKGAAEASYLSSPTGGMGTSPAFSQGAGQHKIRQGEPVLFDYVFAADGYLVDQTRIFAIDSLSDPLLRAHDAMLEIQNAVADSLKPGVTGGEIYQLAFDLARRRGYAENFGGIGKDRVSFVGHGVGLEVDEYPFLAKGQTQPIEAGMVVAVEPKATFPRVGTVGIENQFVVTERGAKRITRGEDKVVIVDNIRHNRSKSQVRKRN